MNCNEVIINRMKDRGYTFQVMSDKLGYKTASGVSERLRNKTSMRVDVLIKMLEAMDCEVVVRTKTSPKQEWVLTASEENEDK